MSLAIPTASLGNRVGWQLSHSYARTHKILIWLKKFKRYKILQNIKRYKVHTPAPSCYPGIGLQRYFKQMQVNILSPFVFSFLPFFSSLQFFPTPSIFLPFPLLPFLLILR